MCVLPVMCDVILCWLCFCLFMVCVVCLRVCVSSCVCVCMCCVFVCVCFVRDFSCDVEYLVFLCVRRVLVCVVLHVIVRVVDDSLCDIIWRVFECWFALCVCVFCVFVLLCVCVSRLIYCGMSYGLFCCAWVRLCV